MQNYSLRLLTSILTSAPVAVSLVLLVTNDWYLKAAWGTGLTGKLSDFAGVFLLSLIAFAAMPTRKMSLAIGVGIAFSLWKSPVVEPIITWVHSIGLARFNRVVDYTDLVALVMVPVAWCLVERRSRHPQALHALRRAIAIPMLALSVLFMTATTLATHNLQFDAVGRNQSAELDRDLAADAAAEAIQAVANRFKLPCTDCEDLERVAVYSDGRTTIRYIILSDNKIRFWISVGYRSNYRPDGTQIKSRKIRGVLRHTLTDYMGPVEILEVPESRIDIKPNSALDTALIASLFREIAIEHKLPVAGPRHYGFHRGDDSLNLTYFYERSDTIYFHIWGNSYEEKRELRDAIFNRFNSKISGLDFYRFERKNGFSGPYREYIYFQNLSAMRGGN